jgi:hypothetical protein
MLSLGYYDRYLCFLSKNFNTFNESIIVIFKIAGNRFRDTLKIDS